VPETVWCEGSVTLDRSASENLSGPRAMGHLWSASAAVRGEFRPTAAECFGRS
jgi:hypothetical protein